MILIPTVEYTYVGIEHLYLHILLPSLKTSVGIWQIPCSDGDNCELKAIAYAARLMKKLLKPSQKKPEHGN